MARIALIALFVMVSSMTARADQDVYIDQVSGQNLNLTITQKGGDGNTIGDKTNVNPFFNIDGDGQTLTFTQNGDANKVIGTMTGNNIDLLFLQAGDENVFTFNLDRSSESDMDFSIMGNSNIFTLSMGTVVSAEYTTLDYTIDGNDNTFGITIDADGATHTLDLTGDGNTYTINQTGYGNSTLGSTIDITSIGDNNTVTIDQSATINPSNIEMILNGSDQNISINQSNQ